MTTYTALVDVVPTQKDFKCGSNAITKEIYLNQMNRLFDLNTISDMI